MTFFDVNIANNTVTDEAAAEVLKQNIMFYLKTPRGSLPQMRGYGLDYSIIDEPFPIFRMKATVDIVKGIRDYCGISVNTINITADENGSVTINISI